MRRADTSKRKRGLVESIWLRLGDLADYENCGDDIEALGDYLAEMGVMSMETGVRSIYWGRHGRLEVSPYYEGRNYISLYWGDEEGNWLRDLDFQERRLIESITRES